MQRYNDVWPFLARIVECAKCGKQNRVYFDDPRQLPVCGHCRSAIPIGSVGVAELDQKRIARDALGIALPPRPIKLWHIWGRELRALLVEGSFRHRSQREADKQRYRVALQVHKELLRRDEAEEERQANICRGRDSAKERNRKEEESEKLRALLNFESEWIRQEQEAAAQQEQEASRARERRMAELLAVDPGRLYPDEFEQYVSEVFQFLGYVVTLTGQNGDQGVDVLAEKPGLKLAIQAKRYQGPVPNSAVQQAFAGKAHYGCDRCVVVTSGSTFTSGARDLSRTTGCLLIAKDEIPALLRGQMDL